MNADELRDEPGVEEQARANFYALLARFFSAPPDAQLLGSIASSGDGNQQSNPADDAAKAGSIDTAWDNLVKAAASAEQLAVAEEYDQLFVGSGKSEISLYVSAYTARSSVDTKLVALREFLALRGIQRQSEVHEPEDHIAMLFEIMRYLICEEDSDLNEQRSFFDHFVQPGATLLCDAILASERALFFKNVAAFAKSFLAVEHDAFEM